MQPKLSLRFLVFFFCGRGCPHLSLRFSSSLMLDLHELSYTCLSVLKLHKMYVSSKTLLAVTH